MCVEIDLTTIPVGLTLHEPDVFKALKVVLRRAEHTWVAPAALHGWTSDDGAVRAHVGG